MSRALSEAAVRIGIVLNDVIDDLADNESAAEIRADLIEAYEELTKVLSGFLAVDAHKLIQRISEAEIVTARAILRAQGAPI